jgi:hypothetical protein
MIVNFRARGISRGAYKLTQIPILIIIKKKISSFRVKTYSLAPFKKSSIVCTSLKYAFLKLFKWMNFPVVTCKSLVVLV